MALTRRNWVARGFLKGASTNVLTLAASTVGTDYPQPGDKLLVGVVVDNLTASTPSLVSLTHSGGTTGSIGNMTNYRSMTDSSATAGASVIVSTATCDVLTAFGANSALYINLSASVTAKAVMALAFTEVDHFDWLGPSATNTGVAGNSSALSVACWGVPNVTPPGNYSGQDLGTIGTTGGSATTNVTMGMRGADQFGAQASFTPAGPGFGVNIYGLPVAVAQAAYQFFDDGTEAGSVALAAQDAPFTVDLSDG